MYFAQFYRDAAGTQPVCGDRGVVILDGRESLHSQYVIAQDWCGLYKFSSFKIMRGESFTRAQAISPVQLFTQAMVG